MCSQKEIQSGFDRAGHGILTGCVGALDGIALRIQRPRLKDAGDPSEYFNRKGFYALVVQALCDYDKRFRFASCTTPGSTHDSRSFKDSSLHEVVAPSLLVYIIASNNWASNDTII